MAKVNWFEDHQQAKEKAVQQAMEAKEHHLNAMYDNKRKEELQTSLEQGEWLFVEENSEVLVKS